MPVGSHKDAFKAHQLIKKLSSEGTNPVLAKTASTILLDFVKSMRQVNSDQVLDILPDDPTNYSEKKLDLALHAVEKLCGKCDDSHEDACFVNQARRILIKAKTGVDLGSAFDGQQTLTDLLDVALQLAATREPTVARADADDHAEEGIAESPEEECQKLHREIEALKEQSIFRGTLIDEIGATIDRVAQGDFAAAMDVHEDEQLGKLASAFNLMLTTVNQTMEHLDMLVAQRSADMKMVMDTVPVGILSLDENLRVNPDYSKICEKILNMDDLKGREFLDIIGLTKRRNGERRKLEEFLDLLGQQILPEEDMAPLNPFVELEIVGMAAPTPPPPTRTTNQRKTERVYPSRWLRIKYHLIHREEGKPCHFLVLLEDITRAKEMAAQMVLAEKDNMQLKAMAEDPDLFCEFLEEGLKIVKHARQQAGALTRAIDIKPMVNEIFRGVHTIKGTAAAFSLEKISSQAAELENSLSALRSAAEIDAMTIDETAKGLIALNDSFDEVIDKAQELLGRQIGEGNGAIHVKVPASELKRLSTILTTRELDKGLRQELIADLSRLRTVPARKGLARSLKILSGLGKRLDKDIAFHLTGGEVRIDCETARELNTPMVHLFRNAFDHGIETAEERQATGKPEQGQVNLSIQENEGDIELIITDDGRGLVPDKLRESALRKRIITQEEADTLSNQQCCELILRPGFSTSESVSDISGRGVGMDAVLHTIHEDLGGRIAIASQAGKGSTFTINVPKG